MTDLQGCKFVTWQELLKKWVFKSSISQVLGNGL